jgi:SAM-dependent methyltransferase
MAYLKEAFYPKSLEHAKDICLTPDGRVPQKFTKETMFLLDFLLKENLANNYSKVADFGCGVGRMSKALIQRLGCPVTGFDISEPMLGWANEFVLSRIFTPVVYSKGFVPTEDMRYDLVMALFVLQHSEHPIEDIQFIHSILNKGGKFVLMNEEKRFVPSGIDETRNIIWNDDGINIEEEVSKKFKFIGRYDYINRYDKKLTVWEKE